MVGRGFLFLCFLCPYISQRVRCPVSNLFTSRHLCLALSPCLLLLVQFRYLSSCLSVGRPVHLSIFALLHPSLGIACLKRLAGFTHRSGSVTVDADAVERSVRFLRQKLPHLLTGDLVTVGTVRIHHTRMRQHRRKKSIVAHLLHTCSN